MPKEHLATAAWGHFLLPRHVLGPAWQCFAVKKEFLQTDEFLNSEFGALATIDYGMRQINNGNFIVMSPWANWQFNNLKMDYSSLEYENVIKKWGQAIAQNGIRNPNLRVAKDYQWTLNLN